MRKMHIFILILLLAPLLTSRASDNPGVASLSALPVAVQSSVSAALPECGQQLAKLTASDGLDNDRLGWYTAGISGDTVVLGAPYWPDWGTQGRAFVFVKPASGWANMTETATLMASDGAGGDYFSTNLAFAGDTVVAGAPWNNGRGAAYVFVKPASGWANMTETAKLTASDGAGGDQFGENVAIDGDTVVVSTPNNVAAYVFVKPASGWANMTETAKLTPAGGAGGDWPGIGLAISGKTVVVGAPTADQSNGAAYVFVKPAKGWKTTSKFKAKLTASNGAAGDVFAWRVSIRFGTVVVGARGANQNQGAAYVFVKPISGWTDMTETAKLTAWNGAANDQLGTQVFFDGKRAFVGAPNVHGSRGAAYVFAKPKNGWVTTSKFNAKLIASDRHAGDYFGQSVSFDNGTVVVGAPGVNNNSGAAYVFGKAQ